MKKGFTTFVIAIAAIAFGISLSLKPWRVYAQQKRSTQQQITELRRAERERIIDLQTQAKLGSSLGREELARSQGWRKKGEVPAND